MDKSPPNQVEPQLSGPSTSSSTPQENLTAQILQSLVKEPLLPPSASPNSHSFQRRGIVSAEVVVIERVSNFRPWRGIGDGEGLAIARGNPVLLCRNETPASTFLDY
ncbi:hypothetical protein CDAR_76641 [Caerostris darwini]|uniref:Uncharacterized protein n=1 Tax=Caerostris darwini TaxID=1538125 RepID=A0AAV4QD05_9ARAC|nr:hypothetical protein CDAR_76641 [Caerostris darwini]